MRRYIWLALGLIGALSAALWALPLGMRAVMSRLPPVDFSGPIIRQGQLGLAGLTLRRAGVDVTIGQITLETDPRLVPVLRLRDVRASGRIEASFERLTGRLQGTEVHLSGAGDLQGHTIDLRATVAPTSRSARVWNADGPLFVGELDGRAARVERAEVLGDTLRAIDASVRTRQVDLAGAEVEVVHAPCGLQATVHGGSAWFSRHEAAEGGAEPGRPPADHPAGCPIRIRDLELAVRTLAGVRTVQVDDASIDRGSIAARGRTAGLEGEGIAALDGSWAAAEGSVDLEMLARLLGRSELTGHARGAIDVVRTDDGLHVGARGRLSATVVHPKLAEDPVEIRDADFDLVVARTERATRVAARRLALAGVVAHGTVSWDRARLDLDARLTPVDCQTVWDAIPAALRGPYGGARLSGTIAPVVRFGLPRADTFALDLAWSGPSDCTVEALNTAPDARPVATGAGPTDDVGWLLGDFVLPVRYATRALEIGPGTPGYAPIDTLPKWVPAAAIVSEDNAFDRGQALNLSLLRRALMFNLDRGRYVYGGSTIPQQLVKNLFLTRQKTLARKLQEAIVAMRVVQVVPKARVLELYLNCIEFAPNVYGIERAARHYFQKGARQLTPKEAAFLATAKPSPRYAALMRHQGTTPDTPHYREYLRRILERMQRRGVITASQSLAAHPLRLRWRNGQSIDDSESPRSGEHL